MNNDECQKPDQRKPINLDPIPGGCDPILPDSLKNVRGGEFHDKPNQKVGFVKKYVNAPNTTPKLMI
jgi:hypothetical protein